MRSLAVRFVAHGTNSKRIPKRIRQPFFMKRLLVSGRLSLNGKKRGA